VRSASGGGSRGRARLGARPLSWAPPARAPWVERLNALGANLGETGQRTLVALEPEALLAAAREATGLADYGDGAFLEGLSVLTRALEDEASLTLLGRLLARGELQRILQNRLRVEHWIRAHPEVERERVEAPLFVTGLGRAGTTFLHELLAQDPENRVPLLWELFDSVPPPEPATHATDPRAAAANLEITLMDAAVPAFTAMHENAGQLPTECIFVFAHELATDLFTGEFHVPSYTLWLARRDLVPVYRAHRRFLALLQSRHRGARWVLKAPSHLGSLPELFAAYPDARVVILHRDPLRVIGSLANLIGTLRWMRSDAVDYEGIVRALALGFPLLLERMMRQRDEGRVPEAAIVDLAYRDLVADPLAAVASLYERLGLRLSAEAAGRMRASLARPRATHDYFLADTGLDPDRERPKYAAYLARHGS
jgi:hypothetical protein